MFEAFFCRQGSRQSRAFDIYVEPIDSHVCGSFGRVCPYVRGRGFHNDTTHIWRLKCNEGSGGEG